MGQIIGGPGGEAKNAEVRPVVYPYVQPRLARLTKPSLATTTWSSTAMPHSSPTCRSRAVSSRSWRDGVGSPEGWLWQKMTEAAALRIRRSKHVAGVYLDPGQRAARHARLQQHAVAHVESQHPELLDRRALQACPVVCPDIGRVAEKTATFRPGSGHPPAQLGGRLDDGCARGTDPGSGHTARPPRSPSGPGDRPRERANHEQFQRHSARVDRSPGESPAGRRPIAPRGHGQAVSRGAGPRGPGRAGRACSGAVHAVVPWGQGERCESLFSRTDVLTLSLRFRQASLVLARARLGRGLLRPTPRVALL